MRGRRGILLAALGASAGLSFLAIGSASAAASRNRVHVVMRDGPPLAHTGGFGEQTCLQCHSDGALNEDGGSVVIDGLPQRYQPGQRYTLIVSVTHPDLSIAGFEMAARYAAGPDSARQAGALAVDSARAKVSIDEVSHVQYAHHLRGGTTPLSARTGRWTVFWTAPAAGSGSVVFHVAANAANDNDSPMGDYIYARSFTVRAAEK